VSALRKYSKLSTTAKEKAMTKQERADLTEELHDLLERVLIAKEILGNGKRGCAYEANKTLEPVGFRLMELMKIINL